MVLPTEGTSYARVGGLEQLAAEIHGDLAGVDDLSLPRPRDQLGDGQVEVLPDQLLDLFDAEGLLGIEGVIVQLLRRQRQGDLRGG